MNFESLALTETKLSTADGWRERRNWILARGKNPFVVIGAFYPPLQFVPCVKTKEPAEVHLAA